MTEHSAIPLHPASIDLDILFPDLGKPVPRLKPLAPKPKREILFEENPRPVPAPTYTAWKDIAVSCLIINMVCLSCRSVVRYSEGIFLHRVHLHNSQVTELQAIQGPDFAPMHLPKESRTMDRFSSICPACCEEQGYKL